MLLARNASTNAGNLRGAQPEREKYAGKGVDKWECGLGSIANAGFYSNLSMEEAARCSQRQPRRRGWGEIPVRARNEPRCSGCVGCMFGEGLSIPSRPVRRAVEAARARRRRGNEAGVREERAATQAGTRMLRAGTRPERGGHRPEYGSAPPGTRDPPAGTRTERGLERATAYAATR